MPLTSRTSAQKPADDLLAEFRQQFPEISTAGPTSSTAASQPPLVVDSSTLGPPGLGPERYV